VSVISQKISNSVTAGSSEATFSFVRRRMKGSIRFFSFS
jgi:hypothetical protein